MKTLHSTHNQTESESQKGLNEVSHPVAGLSMDGHLHAQTRTASRTQQKKNASAAYRFSRSIYNVIIT